MNRTKSPSYKNDLHSYGEHARLDSGSLHNSSKTCWSHRCNPKHRQSQENSFSASSGHRNIELEVIYDDMKSWKVPSTFEATYSDKEVTGKYTFYHENNDDWCTNSKRNEPCVYEM